MRTFKQKTVMIISPSIHPFDGFGRERFRIQQVVGVGARARAGKQKARRQEATDIIHTTDKNTFNFIEMKGVCGSRCTLEVEQMAFVDGFDVQGEREEGIKGDCS